MSKVYDSLLGGIYSSEDKLGWFGAIFTTASSSDTGL